MVMSLFSVYLRISEENKNLSLDLISYATKKIIKNAHISL